MGFFFFLFSGVGGGSRRSRDKRPCAYHHVHVVRAGRKEASVEGDDKNTSFFPANGEGFFTVVIGLLVFFFFNLFIQHRYATLNFDAATRCINLYHQ